MPRRGGPKQRGKRASRCVSHTARTRLCVNTFNVCMYMCVSIHVWVYVDVLARRTRGLLSEASKAPVGVGSFVGPGGIAGEAVVERE